jgi:cytochrome c biogenesis factor
LHRKHGSFRLIAAFAIQIKTVTHPAFISFILIAWNPFKEIASLSFTQGLNHDPMGSPAGRTTTFIVLYFVPKFQQRFTQVMMPYCQIQAEKRLP